MTDTITKYIQKAKKLRDDMNAKAAIVEAFKKGVMMCLTCKYAPTCGNQDCLKCPRLKEVVIINLQKYDRTHPVERSRTCDC